MKTKLFFFVSIVIAVCLVSCNVVKSPKEIEALKVQLTNTDSIAKAAASDVNSLKGKVEENTKSITTLKGDQKILTAKVDNIDTLVSKLDTIVMANDSCLKQLNKNYTELANAVWLRGRQINGLTQLVFKVAFQGDSASVAKGNELYNQYVNCGNRSIVNQVIENLTENQVQKLIELDNLKQRLAALEAKTK